MLVAGVVALAALLTGIAGGRVLANRGLTAANALTGRQVPAYGVFLGIVAVGALLYWGPRLRWMPTPLVLYSEAMVWDAARGLAAAALGLLLGLEWSGRRDRARLRQLVGGGVALALGLGFLLYRALPVTDIIGPPAVLDGVVIQTTPYTCAPAAIATLARATGLDTGMTELDAVRLAGTTREGTNARAELRALRALGLAPSYRRHLTTDSLSSLGPAVLHVNEPVLAATIRHAVALLAVDTARRTITVGNPLHGRQVKRFAELQGYWIGEAVTFGDCRRKYQ